jgi:alkylated DNA repair dioxygenase AlkB
VTVQLTLFDEETAPARAHDFLGVPGLVYCSGFLNRAEQLAALSALDAQPWLGDLKRRVQHYGYKYDYKARSVDHTMRLGPLPPFALDVAHKLRALDLVTELPDQLIVNEYVPGQGITAHVDCVPCFKDRIVTVSLGSAYEMEFGNLETGEERAALLEVGSALVLTGPARYDWTHQIRARKADNGVPRGRRVSLTFRNVILRADAEGDCTVC